MVPIAKRRQCLVGIGAKDWLSSETSRTRQEQRKSGGLASGATAAAQAPLKSEARYPSASQTAYAVSVLRPGTLQTAGVAQRESLIAGLPVVARVAIGTDVHTAVPVDNQSSSSSLVS